MNFSGTFIALVPPLLAIILGITTKKVNLSLIIGIIVGVLLYSSFNPLLAIETGFEIMESRIGGNVLIIIFLIMLGMFVYLINISGASKKYGIWARKKLKSKRSSLLATFFLGILIFIDDYFNCLTVGTIMAPITDKFKVSREKLAYIIDTTAAPVCMLAPISSWAAAVSTTINDEGLNGFSIFVKSIFANYYSILSLIMVLAIIIFNFDFGKMKKYENITEIEVEDEVADDSPSKIIDLILPVVFLIVGCVFMMLVTGGIFKGNNLIQAFGSCNASLSLCCGALIALILTLILYLPRRVISFNDFLKSFEEGFKTMIPSILILSFAWTLGGICSEEYLNCGGFVKGLLSTNISNSILPMIFFLLSILLAFSTGTSWATFIILIPISISLFNNVESELLIITISSILAGSVCGDHLSPISDTTILSSTGAGCNHINHVQSQAIYGMVVALSSFIGYLFAGLFSSILLGFIISFLTLTIILTILYFIEKKTPKAI